MPLRRFTLLAVFLLYFIDFSVKAQSKAKLDTPRFNPSIHIIGKNYGDSVVLRWGPTDAILWRAYNKAGYIVERYELSEKPTQKPVRQKLNNAPIKPWSLEEWKTRADRQDSIAAMAAQLLYGKTNIPVVKGSNSKGTDVNIHDALNQKYDIENRYSLALFIADNSSFIATGLGLRWVDKTIEKGKVYMYSIHAATDPKLVRSDSSAVLIKTSVVDPIPDMPEIFYEEHDRIVKFNWDRNFANQFFTSYFYERSEDQGKTFKRINRKPYFQPKPTDFNLPQDQITLTDSLPSNYKQYYYRIIGVTPFGDLGKPSPLMPVMGRDKTPPQAAEKVSAQHIRKNHVQLKWEKNIKEKDFAGFIVGRSENMDGPFAPLSLDILSPATTEFLDTTALTWSTNYYVVSAIDTAQNSSVSIPAYVVMVDTIPPSKPVGLSGKIDTTGIVKINWKLGKEKDLMGYLIYFANADYHPFVPKTKDFIVDSTFTDSISLKNLTEKIYYRIVAFDKNRNPSEYSEILTLVKPDKIPPVPPVFTKFFVSDTTVSLIWATSSSKDVVGQVLFKREKGGQWTELAKLDKDKDQFIDKKVKKLTNYEYSLVALDDAGHQSERSFPMHVRVYDSGMRNKIEGFTGRVESDGKSVQLSWKYPLKEDFHYIIYRSYNGSGLEMYENVSSDEQTFTDRNLQKGAYEYAVKAVFKDGAQSPLTTPVKLEIKGK